MNSGLMGSQDRGGYDTEDNGSKVELVIRHA